MPGADALPASVRWATALYVAALRLSPSSFRRRYQGEAVRLFRELAADAHRRRGVPGVLGVWVRASFDLLTGWRKGAGRGPEGRHAAESGPLSAGSPRGAGGATGARDSGPRRFHRTSRRDGMLDRIRQDLTDALRQVRREPGFALAAVLTLGLTLGAGVAILALVDGILLEPLPYRDAERVVSLEYRMRDSGRTASWISPPDFADYRERATTLSGLAGSDALLTFTLTGEGDPVRVPGARVTANFFDVLGVTPAHGREFAPGEDAPGTEPLAVISHGLWTRRFGADPGVVGGTAEVNGIATRVLGVLPRDFEFPAPADVWLNWARDPAEYGRRLNLLLVVGRLRADATLEEARAEVDAIARNLEEAYPRLNADMGATLRPVLDTWLEDVGPALLVLAAGVGLLLLITCASLANLMLARSLTRRREIAVRRALGAGTPRLVRQFCAEGLLLAGLGAGTGSLLGIWGVGMLVAILPADTPRLERVGVDMSVVLAVVAVASVLGLALGPLQAWYAGRSRAASTLQEGRGADRGGQRLRAALVVAQVAVAATLLVGAGLLGRSFLAVLEEDPGFRPDGLVTLRVSLPDALYPEPTQCIAFFEALVERARALPGVESATLASGVPLSGGNRGVGFYYPDGPVDGAMAAYRAVWPGYFRTMGIPLLRGRAFQATDDLDAPEVVVVSESLARSVWPDEPAVGKRIGFEGPEGPWVEVVGVVGDVRDQELDSGPQPIVYVAHPQRGWDSMSLVARAAAGDPGALVPALREQVWALDPQQPVYAVATMDELMSATLAERRLYTGLLAIFALAAFALAVVGLYGIVAWSVRQRTRELGVRIALGARTGDVIRGVVARGLGLVAAGVVVGLLAAAGTTRLMSSLLYGVGSLDPLTLVATAALLLAVGAAACYRPAREATRVDPVEALRAE